jgi:hypothetical protein
MGSIPVRATIGKGMLDVYLRIKKIEMTLLELELELKRLKISKDSYSLNGGLPNECFCISQVNSIWKVYYSERGHKSQLKIFKSESEACIYFLNFITADRVVMRNLEPLVYLLQQSQLKIVNVS